MAGNDYGTPKNGQRKSASTTKTEGAAIQPTRVSKKQLSGIQCRCSYRCRERVNAEEQERIFNDFYALASHDTQNKYLYGLIHKEPVKRQTTRPQSLKYRRHTLTYHVRLQDGAQVQICKKTFCNLHAVSKRRVENLAEKLVCGILVASDQRGKHSSRPHAISEQLKKQIRQHIESFPCRKSHYSQTDNRKRRYLSENLSISRMYLLYLEKHEPQVKDSGDKPQVKEWLYRKIFNEEYNLSFGYPRSDTCETCDLLHVAIQASKYDTEREEATSELAEHQEKASQGYSSL